MNDATFDYVIVGAGSAGCVLANRLSANPNTSVCLIEAGPEDKSFLVKIPVGIVALLWDPRHNWRYYSEPEPYMNNRKLYCPRGKVLGGSSAINAMVFTRGVPADFNRWEALGNEGWGWDGMLPHFKATQKQLRPGMDERYHGYSGEQLTTDVYEDAVDQLSRDFVEAVAESGVAPKNNDFNGEQQEGAGLYQSYQTGKGQRYSGANAFLHPIRHRKNLTVITKALVEKVLFDGKKAIGVQCRIKNKQVKLFANDEVILSAGSINSPQLLQLSGVGNKADLEKVGVDVVHDLPGVGENLQDHIDVIVNTRVKSFKGIGVSIPYVFKAVVQLFKYLFKKTGHVATTGAEAGGFIKSDSSLEDPDIQMHFAPVMLESHFIRSLGHGHGIHFCNLQPKSRGFIKLKSNNPTDAPAIQFNYLEHPDDIEVLVKAVKLADKILSAPSLAKSEKSRYKPLPSVQTDEQIKEFIRNHGETIYHPIGTCKMGSDDMAVVDTELRVHGVQNLRVVDASIMPTINSGNTHAVVIAIANKAAEAILAGRA